MSTQKIPIDIEALFPEINQIEDQSLRQAVVTIWNEMWDMSEFDDFEDVPVSYNIIYPQRKHCQGILRAALAAAAAWESVHDVQFDRDTLIAGALLMDVGKLAEIRPKVDGAYRQTEVGRNLPHAFYAAHRALALGVPLPVVHIITTHSPNSGKPPNTPECQLLDWIDQADITAFGHEIWTRKVMHYQP